MQHHCLYILMSESDVPKDLRGSFSDRQTHISSIHEGILLLI